MSCIDDCFSVLQNDLTEASADYKSAVQNCTTNACLITAAENYLDRVKEIAQAFANCTAACKDITPPPFGS